MGKDYPMPYPVFCRKLKGAFRSKRELSDPEAIEKALEHAEYIKKELIALHKLRIYRAVKRNYNY